MNTKHSILLGIWITLFVAGGMLFFIKNNSADTKIWDASNTAPKEVVASGAQNSDTDEGSAKVLDEIENNLSAIRALEKNYPEYREANLALIAWDNVKAFEIYSKLILDLTNPVERSIVDFGMAQSKFNTDRKSGIDLFIALSKNETYPKRTRALALQRMTLWSINYNDPMILKQIIDSYEMKAISIADATNKIMQIQFELDPYVGSAVWLASSLISTVPADKPDIADSIYKQYEPFITKTIAQMKNNPGEQVELTSAMLGRASILARLHTRYKKVPRTEVDDAFKEIITYSTQWSLTNNQQYSMLQYADFLMANGDKEKAITQLKNITERWLTPALTEALPRSIQYPALTSIPLDWEDQDIQELIKFIGSKAQSGAQNSGSWNTSSTSK